MKYIFFFLVLKMYAYKFLDFRCWFGSIWLIFRFGERGSATAVGDASDCARGPRRAGEPQQRTADRSCFSRLKCQHRHIQSISYRHSALPRKQSNHLSSEKKKKKKKTENDFILIADWRMKSGDILHVSSFILEDFFLKIIKTIKKTKLEKAKKQKKTKLKDT